MDSRLLELQQQANDYSQSGRHEQACQAWQQIIQALPEHAIAWYNWGTCLIAAKQYAKAITTLQYAAQLDPKLAEIQGNLGYAYELSGQLPKARQHYQASISLNHDYADGYYNLARHTSALKEQGQLLRHALALDATQGRIILAWADYLCTTQNYEQAKLYYYSAFQTDSSLCSALAGYNWCRYKLFEPHYQLPKGHDYSSSQPINPFTALYLAAEQATILHITQQAWQHLGDQVQAKPAKWHNPKIHLGYVSPDFSEHAVGLLMINLILNHNPEQFQVYCYDLAPTQDSLAAKFQSLAGYRDCSGLDINTIVGNIRQDKVDILIDLSGFTQGAKPHIFQQRAAAVQIHCCGWPNTMGSLAYDFIIADSLTLPESLATTYPEKILHLPYFISIPAEQLPSEPQVAVTGLPKDKFIFCCLVNEDRIEYTLLQAMCAILQQCPHSILWLNSNSTGSQKQITTFMHEQGIAGQQLFFSPPERLSSTLVQLHADLWLDSFSLTSGTAAILNCQAGMPMLTRLGPLQHQRTAGAILSHAGLNACVCSTTQEYIKQAIFYYQNPARLAKLKGKILSNKATSKLFAHQEYRAHFEAALVTAAGRRLNNPLWQQLP